MSSALLAGPGATITQVFTLHTGAQALTPVLLFAICVFIAWGRPDSIRQLFRR